MALDLPLGLSDAACRVQYSRIVGSWRDEHRLEAWRLALPVLLRGLRRGVLWGALPQGLLPSRFTEAQCALILTRWAHRAPARAVVTKVMLRLPPSDFTPTPDDRTGMRVFAEGAWREALRLHGVSLV